MDLAYDAKRLIDVARAFRLARRLAERERWPPERLRAHQQERLEALVRHALAHSPFYRERLPATGPVDLAALPVLDKATLMEHFDALVCDRRLRRDALLDHLEGLDHDALYLGDYRAMTTSGSSGRKGLYVYDRPGWVAIAAQFFRFNAMAGVRPRLPRLRMAVIGGGSASHMSRRGGAMLDVGVHRILSLPVTLALPRLVAALNDFRPQYLNVYPTLAALLADEKLAGRLRIAPEVMSTSSELRTPEVTARIEAAFGVRPFEIYATTEGLWGGSCEAGEGIHLFEDLTVVENVDEDGRAVPAGERGARLLVTSLFNRVQPLIRFEISDMVTLAGDPCPCGRTLARLRAIDGRADDVLVLGGVAVTPVQFGVVTADRDVREYQVVQEGEALRLRVVLRDGVAAPEACERLGRKLAGRLKALGVRDPRVAVQACAALERPPSGKLQLVVADRGRVVSPV
jgi:phenylacetate-coenzyme A ligase PaaK-like adenylate-forming protein